MLKNLDSFRSEWDYRQLRYQGTSKSCGVNFLYNGKKQILKKAFCHQFSCSNCRDNKIKNTMMKTKQIALEYDLTRFLTITFGGKNVRSVFSAKESFGYVMQKWREFRVYFTRKYKQNLSYILFVRSHKDGYCHLHILINKYIPKKWLNETIKNVGLGYSNIKFVDIQHISSYLVAYLENKSHEWIVPYGDRHYSTSRDIDFNNFIPDPDWIFISVGFGGSSDQKKVLVDMIKFNGYDPPDDLSLFFGNN